MQLVDSKGNVLLEREKSHAAQAKMSSVHTRRISKGLKKTVHPVLMGKEEFFNIVIKDSANGNVYADDKTTFQFRTPSEGGVKL